MLHFGIRFIPLSWLCLVQNPRVNTFGESHAHRITLYPTTIKEGDVTFYLSYFVDTTLTVVTLVRGPAWTRYNERRRNKEIEIHLGSIQGGTVPKISKERKN